MRPGRLLGFGFAFVFLTLGLIFLLASASDYNTSTTRTLIFAFVLLGLGVGLLILTLKFLPAVKIEQTVVQKVDLPGDTELERWTCQSCGALLDGSSIQVAKDGSVIINCPYCQSSYQITEQPKW